MNKNDFKEFLFDLNRRYRIDEMDEQGLIRLIDNIYKFHNGEEVGFESLQDRIAWGEMLPNLIINLGVYPEDIDSLDENAKMNMIHFNPEWILENMGDGWFTNGNGTAIVMATEKFSRVWVEYALHTLDIEWGIEEYLLDGIESYDYFFHMDDIKDTCPEFYEKMFQDNEKEHTMILK